MRMRLVMLEMRRDLGRRVGTGGGCSLGVVRGLIIHRSGTWKSTVFILNVITTYDIHRVLPG